MQRRQAFTLVELLVAMALIIFMMVILAEAFSVGMETFRRLKAIGDMNSRMRTVVVALRSDLQADHFEGGKRLSDPNFFDRGPPQQGFFRIYQGGGLSVEQQDSGGDQIPATRAVNHILHLAVKKRGNERNDFFQGRVPTGSLLLNLGRPDARYQDTANPATPIFTSQWAEVAYFLRPNDQQAGSTPLYALYRRQLLAVPDEDSVNRGAALNAKVASTTAGYLDISCKNQGGNFYFNSPMDLTMPVRRFGMVEPLNVPNVRAGLPNTSGTYPRLVDQDANLSTADLLLTDVISFEVTVLLEKGAEFVDLFHTTVTPFDNSNRAFPAGGPRVFDTWSSYKDDLHDYSTWDLPGTDTTGTRDPSVSIPLYRNAAGEQIRILAVKITLRVWDAKAQQARQVSLIQDL
jgi:type II secretory pathway pseudopilin PulG